eukprot:SAG25_NODE_2745_length_1408_cov_1.766234_2_plen_218_part_00
MSGGVALGEGDCDWDSDCDPGNPLEFWKTSKCGQPRNCDASFKQPDGCDLKDDPFSICDDCCYEKTSSWNLFCGVVVIGGIVGIALCVLCCGDCFDKSKKQATQNQTVLVNTAPVIAQNPVMMVPMQQPMQMPPRADGDAASADAAAGADAGATSDGAAGNGDAARKGNLCLRMKVDGGGLDGIVHKHRSNMITLHLPQRGGAARFVTQYYYYIIID